ncbi:MAG: phenylalanine--tRNA ligase subunit beta [Candidatus Omnitrophica bacterium]|nr:phenylalanine--tRNA ligase subunit beta [Candidatus Omnitrophota bacterium]
MKISLSWLKKYINVSLPLQKLVEKLTSAGLEVSEIHKVGSDMVFDIEITSNRPDWLSFLGIAREVAAVSGIKSINIPKTLPLKVKASMKKPFSIDIKDIKACPRYIGRLITDVDIRESVAWMKAAIESLGARTINNGADITNYCLYETGQPMHAFDFDKIKGSSIIVRRAQKGETIVTIDGVKRDLDESILIIADSVNPIAIAGIMGGIATEVTEETKNILLESAYFDPVTIRRASRKLGVTSESNYRFERKVDSENVLFASCRAAYLYKEICKGNTDEPFLDINYIKSGTRIIAFNLENLERLIGMKFAVTRVKSILQSLGFSVKPGKGKETLSVTVPSFRYDVNIEEDLIEEVARIEGFDKIQEAMPPIKAHIDSAYTDIYMSKSKMRRLLLAQGINEIVTITLMSTRSLDNAMIDPQNRVLVVNPLSAEQEALRTSLLPSTLKVVNANLNRKIKRMRVFEIGSIYEKVKSKFTQTEFASVVLTGASYQNWKDHSRQVTFYDLKGVVESLLDSFGISDYKFENKKLDYFSPGLSSVITVDGKVIVELGKINKKVCENFDIAEEVFFAQLNIAAFCSNRKKQYRFTSVPKYPSVIRDIALVVKKSILGGEAMDIIRETAGSLAIKTELFDVYTGDQVPVDCKSLAFSIEYQSPDATLTEEHVNSVHSKVQNELLARLNASLR